MEYRDERRGVAPWVWVLIVLVALILVFVVWWAVAAQDERETVLVPVEEDSAERQPPADRAPGSETQPVVVERERPVNVYIDREQPRPTVVVVPRDEQPPEAGRNVTQIDVPSRFRYQGETWEPSGTTVTPDAADLTETGVSVGGRNLHAPRGAEAPYDELYLRSEKQGGVYIQYTPRS